MSTTLPFGRIKPATGEKGNIWFPALENNLEKDDAHSHDGVTSTKLPPSSISKVLVAVPDGDFAVQPNGWYRATVIVSSIDPKNANIKFYLNSTSERLNLYWEWASITTIIVEMPVLPASITIADDLRVVLD